MVWICLLICLLIHSSATLIFVFFLLFPSDISLLICPHYILIPWQEKRKRWTVHSEWQILQGAALGPALCNNKYKLYNNKYVLKYENANIKLNCKLSVLFYLFSACTNAYLMHIPYKWNLSILISSIPLCLSRQQ